MSKVDTIHVILALLIGPVTMNQINDFGSIDTAPPVIFIQILCFIFGSIALARLAFKLDFCLQAS